MSHTIPDKVSPLNESCFDTPNEWAARPPGRFIGREREIAEIAGLRKISLRAGCHCNPGAREVTVGFSRDLRAPRFRDKDRLTCDQFLHVIDGKPTGALRASIGLVTTFADVYKYVLLVKSFIDRRISDLLNETDAYYAYTGTK